MKLTRDQVKYVAKLANLPLTDDEEEKYSDQLSRILEYIKQLNQAQPLGVEPTFNVTDQNNVMAEDRTGACLFYEEALVNVLQKKDGFFVTKGVFTEE